MLHYKPLSELFRGKLLAQLKGLGLSFPSHLYAKKWNVNCQNKGNGQGSLEYLSRYLMKGVVSEKSLTQNGRQIHLRYQDSTTKKVETINFSELVFLNRLAEHVKSKGFHTIREYGFLAPAVKKKLIRVQLLLHKILPWEPLPEKPKVTCPCCGAEMTLILRKVDSQWWEKNERHPRLNMLKCNFRNWERNATFIDPLCLNGRFCSVRKACRPRFMRAVELFYIVGQIYLMTIWALWQNHLINFMKFYVSAEALKS